LTGPLFKEELTSDKIKSVWKTHVEKAMLWPENKANTLTPNGTGLAELSSAPALIDMYARISAEKRAQEKLVREEKEAAESGKQLRRDRLDVAMSRVGKRKVPTRPLPLCTLASDCHAAPEKNLITVLALAGKNATR
jgi:hypothetical protein